MKKELNLFLLMLLALVAFNVHLQSQSTCQGIYHDGVASNSWFGDKWDDIWNLDWESAAKACYVSVNVSEEEQLTTTSVGGKTAFIAQAVFEIQGCSGGNGSCCENLCSKGAGF